MEDNIYKHYLERFGNKLCFIIQENINSDIYNIYNYENKFIKKINKLDFYREIPFNIKNDKIVMVLEFVDNVIVELKSVHYPAQTNLTLPPIFI